MAGPKAQRIAPHLPLRVYANVQAFQPSAKPVLVPKPEKVSAEREAALRRMRKIDQAARVLDELEAREADIAADLKELQRAKALLVSRRARIEERIVSEMQGAGFDKIHGAQSQFSLRPAPLALQVLDESKIPDEYFRETLLRSVDKVALKAAVLKGAAILGVALTQKISLVRGH